MRKKIKLSLFISTILLSPLSAAADLDVLDENVQMLDTLVEHTRTQEAKVYQFSQRLKRGRDEIDEFNHLMQIGIHRLKFISFPESSHYSQTLTKLHNDSSKMLSDFSTQVCANIKTWESLMKEYSASLYAQQPEIESAVDVRETQLMSNDYEYYALGKMLRMF
ncbi:hypothetical protein [Candidatus Bodocaedibacter vickermanii]|uniref:Uncharacterized protein n=1 Tax=Candidatus Bodocaedibacter vickermanii TaxID=2741701 RepID=A0A7L9RUQ1_9PROT|nr:hypothetical protein CPBP_01135 [Candidatus Paracaedibacteraceae bacterium 'Lake Konstanz']